jgi:general secretion pathway protein D
MMNRDIAMNVKVAIKSITGFETLSENRYPILSNREVEHDIRLKEGESSIIGGIISDSDSTTISGIPGAIRVPLIKYLFGTESKTKTEAEIIIVITPHIVRLPEFQDTDLETLAILGSGISPRFIGKPVQLGGDRAPEKPSPAPTAQAPPGQPRTVPVTPSPVPATTTQRAAESLPVPRMAFVRLSPSAPEPSPGSRVTVSAAIENAQNASALSFGISYNPKVVKLLSVQDGGFMSHDGKAATVSPRIDNEAGSVSVSLSRPPGTPGISGNGVLFDLVFEVVGAGASSIDFTQASVLDAAQTALPTSSSGTQVTVK